MAFAPALSPSSSFSFRPFETSSPKLPLCPPKFPRSVFCAASSSHNQPSASFTSEQAVLDAIAGFGDKEEALPIVRTYQNDLARLTLVGAVDSRQAVVAAAADGGGAADEHLSAGMDAMVVETIFPGIDDRSTVSTRLFLPTKEVKEKAIKIRSSMGKDMFQGFSSKNILSMTFRQAVLQKLWSIELALFQPGTKRDMNDLENPREVPVSLTLSSQDERIISEIGEVVCAAALENIEKHFLSSSANRASNRFPNWFNKPKHFTSKDSSVVLNNLIENEILANAKMLHEKFMSERGKHKLVGSSELETKSWLTSTAFSELEKIGGPEFCAWISECLPSYILEIDDNVANSVTFGGWEKLNENRWGVVLSHSQMVSLVDIVDMYFEDTFTLPEKRLPCYAVANLSKVDLNKGGSLLKMLSSVLVSGIFFVTISVLGKVCLPHLPIRKNFAQQNSQAPLSEVIRIPHHSLDSSELETCCVSIIRRIKDSYSWPGEITTKSGAYACIGELPKFLRDGDYTSFSISSTSSPLVASEEEMKELEDIASYQVVVSADGNIIGFQPTNRVGVNNWAANPLAKELYGGKKLTPGLLDSGLKMSNPNGVVVLELLISLNEKSNFAMVRPIDISVQN